MKREKQLTKRERKALAPPRPPQPPAKPKAQAANSAQHIHCVACGKHLERSDFEAPATATIIQCQHQSTFATCLRCADAAQALLDDHDRNNQPVKAAAPWH